MPQQAPLPLRRRAAAACAAAVRAAAACGSSSAASGSSAAGRRAEAAAEEDRLEQRPEARPVAHRRLDVSDTRPPEPQLDAPPKQLAPRVVARAVFARALHSRGQKLQPDAAVRRRITQFSPRRVHAAAAAASASTTSSTAAAASGGGSSERGGGARRAVDGAEPRLEKVVVAHHGRVIKLADGAEGGHVALARALRRLLVLLDARERAALGAAARAAVLGLAGAGVAGRHRRTRCPFASRACAAACPHRCNTGPRARILFLDPIVAPSLQPPVPPPMLDDLLQGRDLDSLTDDEKMAVLVKAGLMTSDSPAAAAAPAPQQVAAEPDDEDPPRTEAERLAYLRSRGVEVELAEERQSHPPPAAGGAGRAFTFVRIPAEPTVAVSLESAAAPSGGGDVLPGLLAPRFADDGVMDDATVARETAGRLRNMVAGGAPGAAEALRAPSAETVRGA